MVDFKDIYMSIVLKFERIRAENQKQWSRGYNKVYLVILLSFSFFFIRKEREKAKNSWKKQNKK